MPGEPYIERVHPQANKLANSNLRSCRPLKIPAMAQLSIEAFPAWALLNNVDFVNAEIRDIEGKGFGLVAKHDITEEGHDAAGPAAILRIPRDLVLSAEAVEEYAKVDQNFKQLLDVAGHRVGTVKFSCASGDGTLTTTDADIWREHQR